MYSSTLLENHMDAGQPNTIVTQSIDPNHLSVLGLQARSSKDTVYASQHRTGSEQLFGKYQVIEDKKKLEEDLKKLNSQKQ